MVSELVFPASQMVNPNNPRPLSMEDRVCKLEVQVVELGIKIDVQFQTTEDLVEKLRVKMSSFRDEIFNFKDELLEAMGLDRSASPMMNPVQRSSMVQVPSMDSVQDQFSTMLSQTEVGRDKSAPLVSAEESGYPAGDPEAVMMNPGVECARVMAIDVQKIYPNAKVTIGSWIENGFYYDFDREPLTDKDLKRIKQEMNRIIGRNLLVIREEVSKDEAQRRIMAVNEPYQIEILDNIKEDPITFCHIGDEWWDLCVVPHVKSTGNIDRKAVAFESVAGAYWTGDVSKLMLQRIYGTSWETKDRLKAFIHFIEDGWKRIHIEHGYDLLYTPHIAEVELWKISGHMDFYKENMFDQMEIENECYQLRPMNCPYQILVYKRKLHSYRDFTIRGILDLTEGILHKFSSDNCEVNLSTRPVMLNDTLQHELLQEACNFTKANVVFFIILVWQSIQPLTDPWGQGSVRGEGTTTTVTPRAYQQIIIGSAIMELDVFPSNLRMQGCSGIPFDPGGILHSMSRPKSTAADDFGRHLQMKDRLIEFNDTLVRMLLLVSVISSASTGYDGDKGGGKRFNEFKGSLSTFIGVLCAVIWTISLKYFQENSKVFVKNVAGLENRNTLHKAPNGLVWQRVNNDFASNFEINEGGELMSLSDISTNIINTYAKLVIGVVSFVLTSYDGDERGEKKLNDFGESLTAIIGVICAVIWLMNVKYFLSWEFVDAWLRNFKFSFEKCTYHFEISVAWIVAATPKSLPIVITSCTALESWTLKCTYYFENVVLWLPFEKVEMLGCTSVTTNHING
nr:threonine--tRNA ligase, chloroplastic/mitochondrial 2 [Ipomoea batatas]